MTKSIKRIIITMFTIFVLTLLTIGVYAAENSVSYTAVNEKTVINSQTVNGNEYLFLPSSADLSKLVLNFGDANQVTVKSKSAEVKVTNGEAFDLTSLFNGEQDEYTVTVISDKNETEITIMKSANIRSVFLVSDDPVNQGRTWVDTAKTNKAKGYISVLGTDGEIDHADTLTQIKGRGNASFRDYKKKPYQIKLSKKADLLNLGSSEKNKTWVLLANAVESTLMRHTFTFEIARSIGMEYTPNYEYIDLYYDGEYRGNYLLCEKTEVASSRVDIQDLDDAIEEANENNPAYDTPEVITATFASNGDVQAKTSSAGSYKYVKGLNEPALEDGTTHHGYLLEIEISYRYEEEQCGFVTTRGQAVVTKNPEYLTKETGAYISNFWQEFEDAVYSENGYNAKTGKYYYEYCDLNSLVNLYLVNEFGKNHDGFMTSTFFYLPEDEDIMYAGPVWDYDACYGIAVFDRSISTNPENFYTVTKYLVKGLIEIESFRDAVQEKLNSNDGEFYLAVKKLLVDDDYINTTAAYLDASQKMNFTMWDITPDRAIVVKDGKEKNYANGVEFLEYFAQTRLEWLSEHTSSWNGSNYELPVDTSSSSNSSSSTGFFAQIINLILKILEWFSNLFN